MSRNTPWRASSLPMTLSAVLAAGCVAYAQHKQRQVQRLEQQVAESQHDPMSGALRREPFNRAAGELLRNHHVTLLFLDLDKFKELNDTRGHAVGDDLIAAVTARLRDALPQATVGRFGGDEFVAAVPNAPTGGDLIPWVDWLFGLLTAEVDAGHVSDGQPVRPWMSIGAAPGWRGGDVPLLERQADVAMYRAKQDGGGTAVYDPAFETGAVISEAPRQRVRDVGPETAMA